MSDDREYRRKAAVLAGVCETFGRTMTDAGVKMYLAALQDLSADEFARAAATCIRSCQWFPSAAIIRETIGKGTPLASRDDKAIVAWGVAWSMVHDVGAYRSVAFADPIINAVVSDMGGWPAFCRPEQDEQWHRKAFIETYRALAASASVMALGRLPGLHERGGGSRETCVIGVNGTQKHLTTSTEGEVQRPWGLDRSEAANALDEIKRRAGKTIMDKERLT